MRKSNNRNKQTKGQSRRRRGGKRGGYAANQSRSLTFFDPEQFMTMKYSSSFNITNLTTVASNAIFRLNSVFAPVVSGGGGAYQPYGFDQMAALYNRFRVRSCKWKVIFGGSTGTFHVAVVPSNGNLAVAVTNNATYDAATALPYAKVKIVTLNGDTEVLAGRVDLAKIGGVRKIEFDADDRFASVSTTNPTEVVVLNVMVFNPAAATLVNSVTVVLEYRVDWTDPIVVGQSTFTQQYILSQNKYLNIPLDPVEDDEEYVLVKKSLDRVKIKK